MKRICLNIGEIAASREPVRLETILGSCVAVCLWDSEKKIGGLNHYLVPTGRETPERPNIYGINAIRALIEKMIRLGSEPGRMQARIFGGGSILKPLEDMFTIGTENVRLARSMLAQYGIPVVKDFVGAECGIRISFTTSTGEVSVTCFDQESGRRYEDFIKHSDEYVERDLDLKSVHTTGFLCNKSQLAFMASSVLPAIISKNMATASMRIWYSGCTTGEEAYSVAITVSEFMRNTCAAPPLSADFAGWDVRLLATDSSRKTLKTAAAGCYGIEQLSDDMPDEVKQRYFLKGQGEKLGYVKVKPLLRDAVIFRHLNLKIRSFPFKRPFDIIFCRDMMKAYDDLTKQRLMQSLHSHLTGSGFLFLGAHDDEPDPLLFRPVEENIYQKQ